MVGHFMPYRLSAIHILMFPRTDRDKKLESWVKDLGGGGRGEPTIVTPKQCEHSVTIGRVDASDRV